jgi:hypothetical protein
LARAGLKALQEGRPADAISEFRAALALEPDRPDLNNLLGVAYLNQGQAGDALAHLERAVELGRAYTQPEHQKVRQQFQMGLASAYAGLDRLADARRTLDDAIASWPEAAEPRLQLGQLLFSSCEVDAGLKVYDGLLDVPGLDGEVREMVSVVVGAVRAFRSSEIEAETFLLAHCESYRDWFTEVAAEQEKNGWYAEAARMVRGEDGEPVPLLAEGARSYAMLRVDLVNPETGETAEVYNAAEPMVVGLSGFEVLAQIPVLFPWTGQPFDVWVSTQVPWHWLPVTIQLAGGDDVVDTVDEVVGAWYLSGFNGDFGEKDRGRFHFVTDPQKVGERAVSYVVDLGRADFRAVQDLLTRLAVLHERRPVKRVIFGRGQLPD